MPFAAQPALHPRKTPIQARSTVTVDAILEATIQVLLTLGKERLTTTAVAHRAGVSVGTLYQYFPNKRALLQACLKRHMNEIGESVLRACEQHRNASLFDMADSLIYAYLAAKMRDVKTSAALYAVASDIEGHAIAQTTSSRSLHVIASLFATARERLTKDPELIASVVVSTLNGISRRILESKSPERTIGPLREELLVLVHAYLQTCIAGVNA
ncbi:TetR/AcrR family transcriptional regulator [Acidicapsa dinghuensis]|uniref:TetR/AcrR family transcriptional regulator n=1 Tax=Acidicapsa dinghuensis TaxID=2218256 RepID=A0ABW1EHF4_9BACT|nr:TetR/AcrR family transcriptional regulator [Acidicapsa dinghuensis]